MTILAADTYRSNAELIETCFELGYLNDDWSILDVTYGRGTFWKTHRPPKLVTNDIRPFADFQDDFRVLHWPDDLWSAIVFDPPYKLNGRTDGAEVDERYGVHEYTRWQDRMALIKEGIHECLRVVRNGGYLLLKCQDQVCSGKVRWQTLEFTLEANTAGAELIDHLLMLGHRPQPEGRRQVHARRNYSSLLVFRKRQDSAA